MPAPLIIESDKLVMSPEILSVLAVAIAIFDCPDELVKLRLEAKTSLLKLTAISSALLTMILFK